MRRYTFMLTAALVAAFFVPVAQAQYSSQYVRGGHQWQDKLNLSTHTQLTGAWSCSASSTACTEDGTIGALTSEVGGASTTAAVVMQDGSGDWRSYTLTVVDDDSFTRSQTPFTGVTDSLVAISASDLYEINTAATATLQQLRDGAGNALPLRLSTNMVMVQRDSATAAEIARLYNGDDTATGETTQTAQLTFYFDGSSDSGSTHVAHEGGRIEAYKVSDWWHAADETDHDSGLKFFITMNGTETNRLSITPSSVSSVGGFSGTSFTQGNDKAQFYNGINLADTYTLSWSGDGTYYGSKVLNLGLYNDGANDWLQVSTAAGIYVDGGAKFGGGYGDTGCTITTEGVLQCNGAITSGGSSTFNVITLGGTLYGSASSTIVASTHDWYWTDGTVYGTPDLSLSRNAAGVLAIDNGDGDGYGDGALIAATITASTDLVIPNGAAPAATCTVGEIYIDTDESDDTNCTTTADNSLCICTASNTWTALENN